jgi:N-acetylglutamate synthase-like GNAT family acetyltransferase
MAITIREATDQDRAAIYGVGSELLTRLEARAVDAGLSLVWVRATLNAQRFYAARGYRPAAWPRTGSRPTLGSPAW